MMLCIKALKRIKYARNRRKKLSNTKEKFLTCTMLLRKSARSSRTEPTNFTTLSSNAMRLRKQSLLLKVISKKWIESRRKPNKSKRNSLIYSTTRRLSVTTSKNS